MPEDQKHVVQVAASGSRGAKLYAGWCRCGWSTPLLGLPGHVRQKAVEHFREVGGGEIKGDG